MRLPTRRGEALQRLNDPPEDHYLTRMMIERLKRELIRLEGSERKEAVSEVRRLAEMGDFSENAGYQIAKATLRRINNRIIILKERLASAIAIDTSPSIDGRVRIGSTVMLEKDGKNLTFQVVGSSETNPSEGRISRHSPLGSALIGQNVGDQVKVADAVYRIASIK